MGSIINQKEQKIKDRNSKKWVRFYRFLISDIFFYIVLLIFISVASFLLGKMSVQNQIEYKKDNKILFKKDNFKKENIFFVASKKGSVYHLPWCPGAIKMKDENKFFFKSKEDAQKAGYLPAKNCEGL